jgi:hypothetical protein
VPNAGLGLFATTSIPVGTVIPYISMGVSASLKRDSDQYMIQSTFDGTTHHDDICLNGDPDLPEMKNIDKAWLFAARINEAPLGREINCELRANVQITEDHITKSWLEHVIIVSSYAVVTKTLINGQELLTHYGNYEEDDIYTRQERQVAAASVEGYVSQVLLLTAQAHLFPVEVDGSTPAPHTRTFNIPMKQP